MEQFVRLKKRREFVHIAEQGRKFVTSGLILQVLPRFGDNQDTQTIRVGFTTSRKVGNAVKRNRVRRRLREVARLVLPVLGQKGCDYVLIGRSQTADRPYLKLVEDLKKALHESKENA